MSIDPPVFEAFRSQGSATNTSSTHTGSTKFDGVKPGRVRGVTGLGGFIGLSSGVRDSARGGGRDGIWLMINTYQVCRDASPRCCRKKATMDVELPVCEH